MQYNVATVPISGASVTSDPCLGMDKYFSIVAKSPMLAGNPALVWPHPLTWGISL